MLNHRFHKRGYRYSLLLLALVVMSVSTTSSTLHNSVLSSPHDRMTTIPPEFDLTSRKASTPIIFQPQPRKPSCGDASCKQSKIPPIQSIHLPQNLAASASAKLNLFLPFSYHIQDPQRVASSYNFVWGAQIYHVAAFKAGNPAISLSYYLPFNRDAGTYGNLELGRQRGLSYWQKERPDWVLYRCDRKTPAYFYDTPNIPLDFTNPEVVRWQIQTYAVPASQNGYDALAADNVNLQNTTGACGFYRNGQWVQRYDGTLNNVQWRKDVANWLQQMQQELRALPRPLKLVPNLNLFPLSPFDAFSQNIIASIGAVMDESSFTRYGKGYVTDDDWLTLISYIKDVQSEGKHYYILNEVSNASSEMIRWNLASYLMAQDGRASLHIAPTQQYGHDLRYQEYNVPLGSAVGEMYSQQNVYLRPFTNGLVLVNPGSSATRSVQLPENRRYVDCYGKAVAPTFTMPPHSGMILLYA